MVLVWLIYKRMEFKKMYLQIKHNIFSIFFFFTSAVFGWRQKLKQGNIVLPEANLNWDMFKMQVS